jgi:SAM-dependent methyltransferase
MGSATIQGKLWGAKARDFATRLEQLTLPLLGAVLDAARVQPGIRLLDAGCGAGLLPLLATLRGAQASACDASAALIAIARQRLPDAELREADLESLPWDDASFDAVTSVNAIFYASDMDAAMRELRRVARPGGRVVVTAWGSEAECEFLSAWIPAVGPLMPPPPPGVPAGKPGALSEPGMLAGLLARAGLRVVDQGRVACPFVFPDMAASWKTNASAGVNQLAIDHSGTTAVRRAFEGMDRAHMRPDGTIRYENTFLWVAGERTT